MSDKEEAARYRWIKSQVEFIGETREWDEFVGLDKKGRKIFEVKSETFWTFHFDEDWRLCVTQDDKPCLDEVIDSLIKKDE